MKRWYRICFTGLITAVLLVGCTKEAVRETEEEAKEALEVTVVSNGISYTPFENFTNSLSTEADQTGKEVEAAGCGLWLTPERIVKDTEHEYHMPEVFYGDDFKIKVKGNGTNPISWKIYNMVFQEVESGTAMDPADILIPVDGWNYYVQLEVSQGDEKNYCHYQYFFKVVRGGPLPQIRVTYEKKSKEIPSASGVILWNEAGDDEEMTNTAACGPEPFAVLTQDGAEIPYLPLGRFITIELTSDKRPEEAVLSDFILGEDGSPLHGEKNSITANLEYENHEMSFCLTQNANVLLSSSIPPYVAGGVLRGFKLKLSWEDGSEAEYGFVVRTDSTWVGENPDNPEGNHFPETEQDLFLDIRSAEGSGPGEVMVLEVNNQSAGPVLFGEEFTLLKIVGTEMNEVPMLPGTAWKSIAYQVSAGSYKALTVDLRALFGELEGGIYRIRKNVRTEGGGNHVLTADFSVSRADRQVEAEETDG